MKKTSLPSLALKISLLAAPLASLLGWQTATALEPIKNYVQNGSFEEFTGTRNTYGYLHRNLKTEGTEIPGWTYLYSDVTPLTTDYALGLTGNPDPGYTVEFAKNKNIPDGRFTVFLQRPGTLWQDVSGLTVGETYLVEYCYNHRGGEQFTTLTSSIGGISLQTDQSTSSLSADYGSFRKAFVATGETMRLSFANTTTTLDSSNTSKITDSSILLDNVSVISQAAIPIQCNGWIENPMLWQGDSTNPVSAAKNWTHALNFGQSGITEATNVNGIAFKSCTGTSPTGSNFAITSGAVNPDAALPGLMAGDAAGSKALANGFTYGVNRISLSDLIPGLKYETTLFGAAWSGGEPQRVGEFTAPDGSKIRVDEQTWKSGSTRAGGNFTWYGTASEDGKIDFTVSNPISGAAFHLYALANAAVPGAGWQGKELVMATGFGGLNNTNTNIAGTALDYFNAEGAEKLWVARGQCVGNNTPSVNVGGIVKTGANSGLATAFTSENYAGKNLVLSMDLKMGTLTGDQKDRARGIGLGFFDDAVGGVNQEVGLGFSGVVVAPNGDVMVYNNQGPNPGDAVTSDVVGYGSGFDKDAWYTLTVDLMLSPDGETAKVKSVSLDGSAGDFDKLVGLELLATDLVGVLSSSANSWSYFGYVDNLVVATYVPEPASWVLLIFGSFILAIGCKNRKKP